MSVREAGPSQEGGYLQLLRKQIALYQALADVRAERNDLHDAKMRAWDEHRPNLNSNGEFEALWLKAKPAGKEEEFAQREREVMGELAKVRTVLDHLTFAGLGDLDDRA
jgi:hypothetical protein